MLLLLSLVCATTIVAAGCSEGRPQQLDIDARSDDRGASSEARIRKTAQHRLHANAEEPVECEACHETLAGQYLRAESWRCEKCHADEHLVLHAAAPEHSDARECWSCHDFSSNSERPTPCLTCHEDARGSLPAITPHDPEEPDEDCSTCHRAHEEPALVSTACETCHDEEQVSGHDAPDIQITGCASCHGYHEEAETAGARCTNCHRQSRARVSMHATFEDGHDECVTCHRPHQFTAPAVLGCQDECHDGVTALSQGKAEEHRGCLGCHDNHDVRHSPQESCADCHGTIVPEHPRDHDSGTRCVGCHEPHEGPAAPVAVPCSDCHDDARSDKGVHRGASGPGPACRDCHEPHRFTLKEAGVGLCLDCHGDRPFENAAAIRPHAEHGDCFSCHGDEVAHEPAGERVACASCHQKKASATREEHQDCVGCHEPHSTEQQNPCGTCHEAQAGVAQGGHQDCVSCHEPHSTEQKKACRGCHEAQARTAPTEHRDCAQCHDQHSTLVKTQCAECHQDRSSGVHEAVTGGCASCHRAHGPGGQASPPACTSCHDGPLPGMHQNPDHDDCTSCHSSHGGQPYRQTGTCLACHEEMRDHEPDATMCTGCHVFGGAE